jgi:hypothetical protein
VGDLRSSAEALRDVLDPAVRVAERPNAIHPQGTVRGRDAAVATFLAGKRLLATQTFEVLKLAVAGDRVPVRAAWRGTIAEGAGALPRARSSLRTPRPG